MALAGFAVLAGSAAPGAALPVDPAGTPQDTTGVPLETVAAVRRDADGDYLPDRLDEIVRVRGVVTSAPRSTGRESQLLNFQDETGGLVLYRSDTLMLGGLEPGERVEAVGRLSHDDGMEEIRLTDLRRLGTGPVPRPLDVPAARLQGEELAGRLVRVSGRLEVRREGGLRLAVVDSSGAIPVYLRREHLEDPDFTRRLFSASRGSVIGIASQSATAPYDHGYDLIPRSPADFRLVPPPPYRALALAGAVVFLVLLTLYAVVRRRRAERQARDLEVLAHDLEKRDGILEAVAFAAARFLGDDDLDAQIEETMERLLAATGADGACVVRGVVGGLRPEFSTEVGRPLVNDRADEPWWEEPVIQDWAATLADGRSIQETPVREERSRRLLDRFGVRGLLLVPIFAGDRWWGTVCFHSGQPWLRWSTAETEALNAAASIIGTAIARRAAEDALRQSEEQFRQAQKMEAIGRLAGGIAHDFNNLLTAMGGHAELLSEAAGLSAAEREDARDIVRTVERASKLTRQLLAFSRYQALPSELTDVSAVLRDLEPMLRRVIGEHIRLEIDAGEPAWIQIPPGQLEQVVVNLCVNARDAMPDGGRLLLASHVEEDGDEASPTVRLDVSDGGIGMDPEVRDRALDPFFTTKPAGSGTGLGLSTVYGIVSKGGGSVEIDSEPGFGTTVSLRFPAASPPESRSLPITRAPEAGGVEEATVLIAEDEDGVRSLTRRVLERAGFRVFAAPDGPSALRLLETESATPDLLLTDVRMPGMNGHELFREVRQRQPDVRVLFMSGYAAEELPVDEVAPAAFIEKPFSPSDLLRRVTAALRS